MLNNANRPLRRRIKDFLKSNILHGCFSIGQRLGFDILPRHYYSEIPDLRTLRSNSAWRTEYSMIGLKGIDTSSQLRWVNDVVQPEARSSLQQTDIYHAACQDSGEVGFGPVEAQFLHCFILRHRPKAILQVGCGVSTAVCIRAAKEAGYAPHIVCVEPYPSPFLERSATQALIMLRRNKLQDLDPAETRVLSDGDFFFIDSSHTLGPAGEVSRIILEFLPRLRQGVFVHFHDIMFPYDYPRHVLTKDLFFWHETALLQAFLTLNSDFVTLASLAMLHYKERSHLQECLPDYRPAKDQDGVALDEGHFPSSIYLRRIGD